MDKLLPCPFCGSGGELIRHYGQESNRPYWIVTCCKTSAVTKREAIIAWNRRSESEAVRALREAVVAEALELYEAGRFVGAEIFTGLSDALSALSLSAPVPRQDKGAKPCCARGIGDGHSEACRERLVPVRQDEGAKP